MGEKIDAKKIDEHFGPPSYLEALLDDIGTKKGKIVEGLTSFLTLPYVNALKVKDRTGKDVSLYEQVLSLKSRYEDLQERSIPIVKQISAYGRLSKSLLPVVEKEGQITLDTFLQVNTSLVMRYGQESKVIAHETNTLKEEFADLLDLLETNLGEVVKQIAEQENALHEAEKEYAFEKANAIISGVITICFLIGAGVALCMGAVPVAIEIGVHAGVALYETIKDAIKASDLAGVISNLKSGIESAKKTKAQLESLIPKFAEIVKMFSEIGQAWDSLNEGLSEVKDDYLAWSNPKLFTPEMLAMALESWDKVIRGVDLYVSTIHGFQPAPAAHFSALMTKHRATLNEAETVSKRHDLKARALVANLTLMDTSRNLCRDIFSAPPVKGVYPQPADIQNIANNYAQAAASLQQAGLSDVASACDAIQQALSSKVIPSQNDALASLRKFAERQPDIPSFPIQQVEWDDFCKVRMAAVKDGREKVDICYNTIHEVQNSTANLHDHLTARVNELHITLENLERQIHEAEEEKERQMSNPFGIISSLIQELIERIGGLYKERGARYGELSCIQNSTMRAEDCLQRVTNLGNSTGTIDKMWDSMQTQMINAADVWPVLHEVKMSDLEIDLYKTTWNAVRVSLGS